MALNISPQLCREDLVAQQCTTPEEHIFTLSPLNSVIDKQGSTAKSIITITIIAIVKFTVTGISVCIWNKKRYFFDDSVFPVVPNLKMVMRNNTFCHFREIVNSHTSKTFWAHFASVAVYPTRLRLTGYLNINGIQIFTVGRYSRYLQVDWIRALHTGGREHVIKQL